MMIAIYLQDEGMCARVQGLTAVSVTEVFGEVVRQGITRLLSCL